MTPAEVRLLRHQTRLPDGRAPLDLWRGDRAAFDEYQAYQQRMQRAWFQGAWWAVFIGTPDGRTLFAGLYSVGSPRPAHESFVLRNSGIAVTADQDDFYPLRLSHHLNDYVGRLYVDWGGGSSGKRAWRQRADLQDKVITELHLDVAERPFPGLLEMVEPLSRLMAAPPGWVAQLKAARGVYLLTCPVTAELYVGSATGGEGFWGRWTTYAADGHGGNVALRARERSDWIVSILQVAGSADTADDVLVMEMVWKRKLHSRMVGLNRN